MSPYHPEPPADSSTGVAQRPPTEVSELPRGLQTSQNLERTTRQERPPGASITNHHHQTGMRGDPSTHANRPQNFRKNQENPVTTQPAQSKLRTCLRRDMK